VAVVNNDVEPDPDWLERLLGAAESSGTWFATGKLLETAQPGRIDGTYDALCRGGCAWRVGHGRPDGPLWDGSRKIAFAPFTAALFRVELFRRVGVLDERFESYLEDLDFGLRCALQGYEGLYVPQAVAYHQGSATLGAWHKDTIRRIARNQVLLVAKHFPGAQLWRSGWAILVAQTLWGAVALRHGRGGAFLRGKLQGLRMFRQMRREAAWRAAELGRLASVLEQSEAEILEVQRQSGFDRYWRWYFALT
jgi:GT2 family glycosyltransferase